MQVFTIYITSEFKFPVLYYSEQFLTILLQKSASIIRHHESWNMNSSVKIIDDCFQSNEIYYYFALKVMTRKILQYIEDDSRLFLLVHFPQSFSKACLLQ